MIEDENNHRSTATASSASRARILDRNREIKSRAPRARCTLGFVDNFHSSAPPRRNPREVSRPLSPSSARDDSVESSRRSIPSASKSWKSFPARSRARSRSRLGTSRSRASSLFARRRSRASRDAARGRNSTRAFASSRFGARRARRGDVGALAASRPDAASRRGEGTLDSARPLSRRGRAHQRRKRVPVFVRDQAHAPARVFDVAREVGRADRPSSLAARGDTLSSLCTSRTASTATSRAARRFDFIALDSRRARIARRVGNRRAADFCLVVNNERRGYARTRTRRTPCARRKNRMNIRHRRRRRMR